MIAVIGPGADALCHYLEDNGFLADEFTGEGVKSLTGLLSESEEISSIVLMPGQEKAWSMGHILSAAKALQRMGFLIFFDCRQRQPDLIKTVQGREALVSLLRQSKISEGTAMIGKKPQNPRPEPAQEAIAPIRFPDGQLLFIGVAGSQNRIGCTTQAVGLWHYLKAAGFDPAVCADARQIEAIAQAVHGQEIPGGYRIEGIPFVSDTALSYDCYVLDLGVSREIPPNVDVLALVAGCKPWELPNTVEALQSSGNRPMLILLSFAAAAEAKPLLPLFGGRPVAALPWMPELWRPSPAALRIYDRILRPMLERQTQNLEPIITKERIV